MEFDMDGDGTITTKVKKRDSGTPSKQGTQGPLVDQGLRDP